jgi:hypothetical protein
LRPAGTRSVFQCGAQGHLVIAKIGRLSFDRSSSNGRSFLLGFWVFVARAAEGGDNIRSFHWLPKLCSSSAILAANEINAA